MDRTPLWYFLIHSLGKNMGYVPASTLMDAELLGADMAFSDMALGNNMYCV